MIGFNRPPGVEREENDFYATDPAAIPPLLKFLGWNAGGKIIRDNSCGQGHLCWPLIVNGHTVVASDLIDRGFGITGINFLEYSWLDDLRYDGVIMNPPYKLARQFIEKSLNLAPVVCAFLRITFLESDGRRQFFKENPPRYVAVFIERMPSAKNADFEKYEGSAVCYAWFIWERGYKGRPEIIWI